MHEVKLKDKTVDVGKLEQFGFVKAVEDEQKKLVHDSP